MVAAIVEDLDAERQLFAELEALEKFAIIACGRAGGEKHRRPEL